MSKITLENINKSFGKNHILKDINLEIKDKEFMILFGPAGAGKTTMLKTIAGLIKPDTGKVMSDDKDLAGTAPPYRNISMVFENYALYPHKTAFDNIASPMRSKLYRKDPEYIEEKVVNVTKLLKINHLLDRLPANMSNGQRQRVALGRCLVREPIVFLMDEPLAHLDAKLRHRMRAELKSMQANFNTTTVYVTHDYMEALSLGDRVAIINEGKILQIGTGQEIYYAPCNEFVAKLMGEPEINLVDIHLVAEGTELKAQVLDNLELSDIPEDVADVLHKGNYKYIMIGIRGHDIEYAFERMAKDWLAGTVYTLEPIGNKSILTVKIAEKLIRLTVPNYFKTEMNQNIYLHLNLEHAMFFDRNTQKYITRHNQEYVVNHC